MKHCLLLLLSLAVACGSEESQDAVQIDTTADMGATGDAATESDSGPPEDLGRVDVDMGPFGGDRPAKVKLPSDWTPDGNYPVVFLLHGLGANSFKQDVLFQASLLVDDLQFVLVLPEGTEDPAGSQFWNASNFCCDFYASGVDDSTYLMELAEDAMVRYAGNPDRLYFLGHSNGGYMSYRMACDHSDKVAAIASLAGSTWVDPADCGSPDPVSILQIHGTADGTVLYDGRPSQQPGAVEIVERWAERDGCTGDREFVGRQDYDSSVASDETSKEAWRDCDNGTDVELWTMEGSGHIPRVGQPLTRDILSFFFDHELR